MIYYLDLLENKKFEIKSGIIFNTVNISVDPINIKFKVDMTPTYVKSFIESRKKRKLCIFLTNNIDKSLLLNSAILYKADIDPIDNKMCVEILVDYYVFGEYVNEFNYITNIIREEKIKKLLDK